MPQTKLPIIEEELYGPAQGVSDESQEDCEFHDTGLLVCGDFDLNPEPEPVRKATYKWVDDWGVDRLTPALPDPEPRLDPVVLSCGVGVDSISMVLMLLNREEAEQHLGVDLSRYRAPDLVLFADPGHENPDTYDLVYNHLAPYLEQKGMPFYYIQRWSPGYGWRTLGQENEDNGNIPFLPAARHSCSTKFKVEPQKSFVDVVFGGVELEPGGNRKKRPGPEKWRGSGMAPGERYSATHMVPGYKATFYIGLNAGEERRKTKATTYATNEAADPFHIAVYPMLDLKIDREMEEDLINQFAPDTWPVVHKSSCTFCLSGDTEVVTREGIKPIASLAGSTVELLVPKMGTKGGLGENGSFRPVEVRDFGTQQLWKIHLRRKKSERVVYATAEHRWVLRSGPQWTSVDDLWRTTAELKKGDQLKGLRAPPLAKENLSAAWIVVSVESTDREETVYCATVPGAEAFALADDLMTGNCPYMQLHEIAEVIRRHPDDWHYVRQMEERFARASRIKFYGGEWRNRAGTEIVIPSPGDRKGKTKTWWKDDPWSKGIRLYHRIKAKGRFFSTKEIEAYVRSLNPGDEPSVQGLADYALGKAPQKPLTIFDMPRGKAKANPSPELNQDMIDAVKSAWAPFKTAAVAAWNILPDDVMSAHKDNPDGNDIPYDWYNNASHALASFMKHRSWAKVEDDLKARHLGPEEIRQAVHIASSRPMIDLVDAEVVLEGTELEELYSDFLGKWEQESGDPTLATPAHFMAALDAMGGADIPETKLRALWDAYYDMYGQRQEVCNNPGGFEGDPGVTGNEAVFQQIGGFVLGAIAYRALGRVFDWFMEDDVPKDLTGADLAEDYRVGNPVQWED